MARPPKDRRHLLVVGGQRCGTTFLAAQLDSHPEVTMARPARPEPKVFCDQALSSRGVEWYDATYFGHARDERVLAEKSTSYLDVPESAGRAHAMLPEALVLAQLRDPVDRAVSNWRFSRENGLEDRPLEQALRANLLAPRAWDPGLTSASPFAYLERGRYLEHLLPWFHAFDDAVHVTFMAPMVEDAGEVGRLYAALGVDPTHRPTVHRPVNASEGGFPPTLPEGLRAELRAWYADADAALAQHLRRALPWRDDERPDRLCEA